MCRARRMSDEARSAVASFLSVHKGQEKGATRLTTSTGLQDHPFLDSAYQCLEELWIQVGCLSMLCSGDIRPARTCLQMLA